MLAMSGRVTMLGISRWAGIGGSYRTMPLVLSYSNPLGDVVLAIFSQAFRYVREMLKMLPEIPEPILLTKIFAKLTALGRIHPVSTGIEPS
jgi:hypothetical protein